MAETVGASTGNEPPRCPGCRTPLLSGRMEGLCPVCLLDDTAEPELLVHGALLPEDEEQEQSPGPPAAAPRPAVPARQDRGLMELPGYRLTREIARGGMGIIYEATQVTPLRRVAIKMLLPQYMDDPAMRERFRRESQAMAGLDHPGILPVYETGDYNGLPWFSMKLAGGGTLGERNRQYQGRWRETAVLVADLADAIQTAHTHGVLHRDLKPGNILFDDQDRAYLSDFGIAKQLTAVPGAFDLTKSATLLGTPNYLPPEWAAGTARSPTTAGDVYGLGAILYQLLTGDPPHRAAQLTTLLRQIADEPATPPRDIDPAIPKDLETICLRAIAKEPAHRYEGAKELADDLRLWLAGRPIRSRAASPAEKMWRWARRNPLPASLAILLAGALTVGGTILWLSLRESRRNLHNSLIAQAAALRETGRLGNRAQAIAALEQARSLRASPEVQTELTSALAMTDLQERRRLAHGGGPRSFSDRDLTRYVSVGRGGQLTVRRLADDSIISRVPGDASDAENYGPFSPDGRFLAVRPGRGKPFSIWDCREHTFRQRDIPGPMTFSPDSRTLAVGSQDGSVTFMDVLTGAILGVHDTGLQNVRPYSFSPDGTRLVTGGSGLSRFCVLDTSSGRRILEESHPEAARVRCAAWRTDSSGFFIGTESFKIYEWSLTDNPIPRQYAGHQGNVVALAVHPDGEWLLSQAEDGTTRLWNTASAHSVAELPYTGREVRYSPDGNQFLCEDREAKLLHLMEVTPSHLCRQFALPHPDPDRVGTRGCWDVAFSPDGALLAVGDTAGLLLHDGFTGQLLRIFPSRYCWSLTWAPGGEALYTVSKEGLQRWPVEAATSVSRRTAPSSGGPSDPPRPAAGASSPASPGPSSPADSARKAAGTDHSGSIEAALTGVTLGKPVQWEADRYDPGNPSASLSHSAITADGKSIALGYADGVGIFTAGQAPGTRQLNRLPYTPQPVDGLALSADGSLTAASFEKAGGVLLWETGTQHLRHRFPTRFAESSVSFHPDGLRLFVADLEALNCWDVRSGALLWRAAAPGRASQTPRLAMPGDGSLLACNQSAGIITLFHPGTGKVITRLRHPTPQPIAGLAFAPDKSRLAVLCLGHLVQLWDFHLLRSELAARGLDWDHPPLPPRVPSRRWVFPP